jgi:outer membrane protein
MKRGFLFWGGLLALSALAQLSWGAEGIKIGFIDAQKVLENSKAGKQVKSRMEDYLKPRQKIIDDQKDELRRLEEDLNRQASVLSPDAKKAKEEDFRKKLSDYQRRAMELNDEVQSKKLDVLKEFNKKLEEAARQIAEKEGYTFVFDKNADGGSLVYARDTYDLTAKVIEQVDKNAGP